MDYPRKIYLIRHDNTGRIYIGSSSKPDRRYASHMYQLKNGWHPVEDMQTDANKYGLNFTFTIIDEIQDASEASKEYQWMKQFKSFIRGVGYNYKDSAMKNTSVVYHTDSIIDEIYSLLLKTRNLDLLNFILQLLQKSQ